MISVLHQGQPQIGKKPLSKPNSNYSFRRDGGASRGDGGGNRGGYRESRDENFNRGGGGGRGGDRQWNDGGRGGDYRGRFLLIIY